MIYSNDNLKQLARNNQKEFLRIINLSLLKVKELALAVEILGEEIIDETLVLPIFLRCLKHIHLSVRESAIFGITSFYDRKQLPQTLVDRLKIISTNDPSSDIKELAIDLLKKFENI